MAIGAFSTEGTRNKGIKYFVSQKADGKNPRVVIAANERAALESWAGLTGCQANEGCAAPLGTRAGSIVREIKPRAGAKAKETKGQPDGGSGHGI